MRLHKAGMGLWLSVLVVGALGAPSARAQSGCPCDWNTNGSVSTQDLFDFLESYFGGDGDFNCSGTTSTQDIFDFLACFFSGCPKYQDANPSSAGEQEPAAPDDGPRTYSTNMDPSFGAPRPDSPGAWIYQNGGWRWYGYVYSPGPPSGMTVEWPPALVDDEPPVDIISPGEVNKRVTDMRIRGRGFDFEWARRYRSQLGQVGGPMGHGWDHSYNIYLERCGLRLKLHNGWGRVDMYLPQPGGEWTCAGFFREIRQNVDGSYTLTFPNEGIWKFNSFAAATGAGKLASIVDRNNNTMTFSYDAMGRLVSITDTLGRPITVAYNAGGRVASVTDFSTPSPRQVVYTYFGPGDPLGGEGDLKSVRSPIVTTAHNPFPAGKTVSYTYTVGLPVAEMNHNLLTVTDPKGIVVISIQYHPSANKSDDMGFDRAILARMGDAGDNNTLAYTNLVPAPANNNASRLVTVTDRIGHVREHYYDGLNRLVMLRERTAGLRGGEPPHFETRWAYNADGLVTRIDRPRGNFETWVYDSGNPSKRLRCAVLSWTRDSGGLGGGGSPATITESWTYAPGFAGAAFVAQHTDGRGAIEAHSYDAAGNRIQTVHRLPFIVENWEYNGSGQMTKHIHPVGGTGSGCRRVDTFDYHPPGPQFGYPRTMVVDSSAAPACAGGHFVLTTQYAYDARGNLVRQIDPRGNAVDWTINELDQVVQELNKPVANQSGARYQTLYFYDANNNLVREDVQNRNEFGTVVAGNSHITTIREYETLNRLARVAREAGVPPTFGIDVPQATLTISGLTAPEMAHFIITDRHVYDRRRNRTEDHNGEANFGTDPFNFIRRVYDERNLIFHEIRAPGAPGPDGQSTTRYDYDLNGNRASRTRALEEVTPVTTTYSYDGYDRRTTDTDPMGNLTTWLYDNNSNIQSRRVDGELLDVAGSASNVRLYEVTYSYDAMDRLIRTDVAHFDTQTQLGLGADGMATTLRAWNDDSTLRSATDDNAHTTTYSYDTASRRRLETDAAGNSNTYTFDANGNRVTTVRLDLSTSGGPPAESFMTTYTYDALDRVMQSIDNLGGARTYRYDSRSNRTLIIDELVHEQRYAYDGMDRLIRSVRDLDGTGADGLNGASPDQVFEFSWDRSSRKKTETDDNGNTTTYSYDALDRLIRTMYADGTQQADRYDPRDNRTTRDDANGSNSTYSYDALDRLIQSTIAPGPTVGPNPASGTTEGTTSETYQYDGLSRLVRATDNDTIVTRGGTITTNGYDSMNNVLRETSQMIGPATPPRTVTAQYDAVGNQTRLTYPGNRVIARSYDALDRVTTIQEVSPTPGVLATYQYIGERIERRDNGNSTRTDYFYDGLARTVRIVHSSQPGGTPFDERHYTWDAAGNKLSHRETVLLPNPERFYIYDRADRLIQTTGPQAWPSTAYTLDGDGNRTNIVGGTDAGPYARSAAIPPADMQASQYTTTPFDSRTYDDNGNLKTTTGLPSWAGRTFIYDYRNQLVRSVDAATGAATTYKYDCFGRRIQKATGAAISRYYHDGFDEVEEQTGTNTTRQTSVLSRGRGGDHRVQVTRLGARFYLHEDDLGSIVKATNSTGQVTDQGEYFEYGKPFLVAAPQGTELEYSQDADRDPNPNSNAYEVADDFWVAHAAQLTALTWRGGYDYAPFLLLNDQFEIRIYDSDPATSLPFNQVYGVIVSQPQVTRTPTAGVYCCNGLPGTQEFQYQCVLPFPALLNPNQRYWLSIQNATFGDPSTWGWASSGDGNGRVCFRDLNVSSQWARTPLDLAFTLTLTGLPARSGIEFSFMGRRYDSEPRLVYFSGQYLDPRSGRPIQPALDPIPIEMVSLNLCSVLVNNNPLAFGQPWPMMVCQDDETAKKIADLTKEIKDLVDQGADTVEEVKKLKELLDKLKALKGDPVAYLEVLRYVLGKVPLKGPAEALAAYFKCLADAIGGIIDNLKKWRGRMYELYKELREAGKTHEEAKEHFTMSDEEKARWQEKYEAEKLQKEAKEAQDKAKK